MADADVLLKLADRCEAASGPDHEIDLAINRAVFQRYIGIRRWTASLDSAMVLVPEGCVWTVMTDYALPGRARVYSEKTLLRQSDGETPALALCAASLRARAALENKNG